MTNTDELIERFKKNRDYWDRAIEEGRGDVVGESALAIIGYIGPEMAQALQQQKQELEKLRGETLCGVCAGDPVAPCICGGTGKAHMEADGLRQELIKAQQDLEEALRLLGLARCPDVDCYKGAIPHGPGPDGNWEAQQCQWCDETGTLLKRHGRME